ncbi:hypothetical protein KZO85_12580 [Chromohalobacter canadensis]|uniref:hypothetical protein n=1 Tax=Chromohalobacter canadensis TaxID=141389 RepID=UPI0021BE9787|nr:hypothetical protein [Chromohalobacter canadensis]MCT8469421.1 hypothetical protein [Chromohalobacter canadensis]MCT8472045.1 hypothetical protein [Chromohalobacter canadensis]MCT8499842.1 hypothetical protein [Chromohalobacter canadensis]
MSRKPIKFPQNSMMNHPEVRPVFERLLGPRIEPEDCKMKPVSATNVRHEDSVAALASQMCHGRAFPLYLDRRHRQKFGTPEADWPDGTYDGLRARDWLCKACGVRIWSELDTDPEAAERFLKIYNRYSRWQARRLGKI